MRSTKPKIQTIDDYIDTFPLDVRVKLEKLRQAIRKAAPEAEETISYQIPAFILHGKRLVYFAGWKHHISVYPVPAGDKDFKKKIAPYQTGKGTLQFPLDKSLPLRLIRKIVKHRVKQTVESTKKQSISKT
ncbi:MAG TPA: DUF1801 domain-containing protein [Bacteroidota bacterium]